MLRAVRDPKEHMNMRILQSGSRAQDKRESRNHGL